MSHKAKIVWLRILHSFICFIIAVVGPTAVWDLLHEPNHHGGDGGNMFGVISVLIFGAYITYCFIALCICHCLGIKITKTFIIIMLAASVVSPLLVMLCGEMCIFAQLCICFATMTPLYLLVSWAIDKQIEKLKDYE